MKAILAELLASNVVTIGNRFKIYEMEGTHGGSFGQTRLQHELQTFGDMQVEPFLDSLVARLRTFAKGGVFTDDACLLAMDFRRPPAKPR